MMRWPMCKSWSVGFHKQNFIYLIMTCDVKPYGALCLVSFAEASKIHSFRACNLRIQNVSHLYFWQLLTILMFTHRLQSYLCFRVQKKHHRVNFMATWSWNESRHLIWKTVSNILCIIQLKIISNQM